MPFRHKRWPFWPEVISILEDRGIVLKCSDKMIRADNGLEGVCCFLAREENDKTKSYPVDFTAEDDLTHEQVNPQWVLSIARHFRIDPSAFNLDID